MYIALDYLQDFADFEYELFTNPNRIQMYRDKGTKNVATVTAKKSAVRYQGGVKSDILREVEKGEELTVLEELEDWDKVKTADAIIGYIEKKHISGTADVTELSVSTKIEDE